MEKRKNKQIIIENLFALIVISVVLGIGQVDAYVASAKEKDRQIADHKIEAVRVDREESLREFFNKYNSPLVESSGTFIAVADRYNMDYRIMPAISGVESTFCKQIIAESYNCYGWGIYGDNVIYFDSFDHGIEEVGKGLYEGYVEKGADTVEEIAPIYNPNTPSQWGGKVNHFMNQIS